MSGFAVYFQGEVVSDIASADRERLESIRAVEMTKAGLCFAGPGFVVLRSRLAIVLPRVYAGRDCSEAELVSAGHALQGSCSLRVSGAGVA